MHKTVFRTLILFFILFSLSPFVSIKAAENVDIFQVTVKMKDRGHFSQIEAMKKGLMNVIVRASGVEDSTQNEYLISKLAKAQSFIQQYSYVKNDPADSEYPWLLKITFEPASIQQLLIDADIAIWGSRRPVVLLWIAQQEKSSYKRHIIESGSENASKITQLSDHRAIPIRFPQMDEQDKKQVDLTDVWGRFSSPIIKASKRYQSKVILFGRVYFRQQKWHADWQLLLENVPSGWNAEADTVVDLYDQMLSELGSRLCHKYCVLSTGSENNQMLVKIENINDFFEAASAEKYLLSLLPVRDVNLVELNQHFAIYKLRLVSREQSVLEAIALDSALINLPVEFSAGIEKRIYSFKWQP